MAKVKSVDGPFYMCYHFQCGEREWVRDGNGKLKKWASDKEVNKELRSIKNAMAMIDVYDNDGMLVYSEYHQ